ncbi:hypothetical protein MARCHEWKA_03820 [Brevundimonas phage vB_BpoS-Marchewka]|uniref:Uncharacterized protein n=1 Tax=Brevundimonas phage vB_BpoS-Marchewka TaxID=2948604 RepID=A0A9E7SR86_9CAUD|nr:hypothetical protein MARCHEWKA_03820 [Brevundimonas phage vB_BpoS-Marchewka]UTC29340.1 hypothetical protein BAMBUS_02580 [Brevundimonas phage vB_BpoS-Bambus]
MRPLDPETLNPEQFQAICLAHTCVRNTFLEDLHAGITPSSKTGDYSDVKVVTPYGEIPWAEVSRISDVEMKRLMQEVVDKLYTGVRYPTSVVPLALPPWRKPRLDRDLMVFKRWVSSMMKGRSA